MLCYDPSSGRLSPARQCPSPNCDERPAEEAISLLVVHGISLPPGRFGGPHIDRLFCNELRGEHDPSFVDIAHMRVSAHLLIRRDGEIVQYVPLHMRAWHAGVSHYAGRDSCNDFAVGVELEGTDARPYTDAQYQQLQAIYRVLAAHFPALGDDRVVGHSDIAPGRKTDPGPYFDWARTRALLAATPTLEERD